MRAETGHRGELLLKRCRVVPILNGSVFDAFMWIEMQSVAMMFMLLKHSVVEGLNFPT